MNATDVSGHVDDSHLHHTSPGDHQHTYVEGTVPSNFCDESMAMVMYMDGFRFGLDTKNGSQQCLNLYFPNWTLNTKGKFIGAMFGIFVLAILVEGISKGRQAFVRYARQNRAWSLHAVRWVVTFMHGTQALTGYILMLATMTYAAEFLLMTVLGLGIGYAAFFTYDDNFLLVDSTHVTTNPCCNFMEEEAKEVPRGSSINIIPLPESMDGSITQGRNTSVVAASEALQSTQRDSTVSDDTPSQTAGSCCQNQA